MLKKTLAALLAICALLTAFAFADTEITDKDGTATMEVSLTIDSSLDSYTITIPSKITIDPTTYQGSATITVAKGFELVSRSVMTLYLKSSSNAEGGSFKLKNGSSSITYHLYPNDTNNAELAVDSPIYYISRANSENGISLKLVAAVDSLGQTEGTYTDILTFGIK